MEETRDPRVAVVIPCFNDGPLLRETVASIEEPEPVEVIVVDDRSTDATTHVALDELEAAGIRVIRLAENQGPAGARNAGVAAARARYVFPLDSDDLAVAGAISTMADLLDADLSAAVCYGDYLEFGEHELVRAVPAAIDGYRLAYVNEYPITALFRRSVLDEVGAWRDRDYEDWGLWISLAEHEHGALYLGPGRLTFRRRLHGERRLADERRRHVELYRDLRAAHPALFSDLGRLRRASDLSAHRKLLYPAVYGPRRRFGFERHLKRLLDRAGVWTLRR